MFFTIVIPSTMKLILAFFLLTMTLTPSTHVSALPAPLEDREASPIPVTALATLDLLQRDGAMVCTSPSCDHNPNNTTDIQIVDGPITITINISRPDKPEWHREGAHAKHRKVNWPNKPPATHNGTAVQCAGEECINAAVPGYSRVPMVCTHMAGRMFLPKWWTCCPQNTYAAKTGNCCLELNHSDWDCAKGKRVDIKDYLIRK